MYTDEVRVRHAPLFHTHSVKPLSRINPMCHRWVPLSVCLFFSVGMLFNLFFLQAAPRGSKWSKWSFGMLSKRGKGSVGGGEAGKKAKTTPYAGGKSVSEKSQDTSDLQGPPFRNKKVSRQNFSSVK